MDARSINRLPPELLIAIVSNLITDQDTIFRLVTVCRYWHDVFTGTATLWTSVDCRNKSRTSIQLQRSKSNPIDVTIDHDRLVEAVSLVTNHFHRMRSIDVNLSSRQLWDILSLLNGLAPRLEIMRMRRREDYSFLMPFPPYSSFFQGRFPALKTLHLEGYPLDLSQSAPTITNGLTTLILNHQRIHRLRDLLECLEHCENLVHLRIDLPNLRGTVPTSYTVSLPNLRELRLVRSPLTLFHHLSLPLFTDLSIQPRVGDYVGGHSLMAVLAQDELSRILESRTVKGIKITFDGSSCEVALLGPHLVFMERVKANPSRHISFHSDYLDSFQSLPTITTEVLRFVQPPRCPFTVIFRQQSCTRLLLQMPALNRIILDIPSVVPPLIRALQPVRGRVPCPRLQVLIVIQQEGRERHFRRGGHEVRLRNSLSALSNRRKDHGFPLVCSIGLPGSSDWQDIICLERTV